ncbi:MAG: hypothetical protein MJ252_28605 [archaeon]|nr:hypothetical protein [archaeon]
MSEKKETIKVEAKRPPPSHLKIKSIKSAKIPYFKNKIETENSKSAPKYKPNKDTKTSYHKSRTGTMATYQPSMTETNGSAFTFTKSKKENKNKTKDGKLDISAEMQKTSNFTKMNDLKRETNEALRNQKDYQNKINTIKNRINAIKKQEKDWTKKMDQIKRLEQGRENYRNGKMDLRKQISIVEKGKKKEIENKKIRARFNRIQTHNDLEKSADRVIRRKYQDFQDKRAEREKLEGIQKQIKFDGIEQNQQKRVKRVKEIERVKQEEELFELLKEQEKITQLAYVQNLAQKDANNLKNYLEELEKEEENCLKSLKTTQVLAQKKIEESGLSPCRVNRNNNNRNCKTPINYHRGKTLSALDDMSADRNKKRFRF